MQEILFFYSTDFLQIVDKEYLTNCVAERINFYLGKSIAVNKSNNHYFVLTKLLLLFCLWTNKCIHLKKKETK